jgi:alpha-L-rhamnosidase
VNDQAWTARWIEPDEPGDMRLIQRPIHQLAGTFEMAGGVAGAASLRITAHGIYEAFVNGVRVGDHELTPGFTAYRRRLQVQTYDVSSLLRPGENVLAVTLSDGWWRGQTTIARRPNSYGPTVAVLAELTVDDGVVCATGADWISTPSHVTAADLIAGEIHDLRARRDDWALPGTDRSTWDPVRVADHAFDILCDTVGPPVRRMQELPAVSVREVRPLRHIVDFGQVSNGWVRLSDLGPEGAQLTIVHGEALSPQGDDVQIAALAGDGSFFRDPTWDPAFQTDIVTSAGDGATFEPRHSTKGFRYIRIDGHPGPLDQATLTSIVVHNDVEPRGAFDCDVDDLNWLHTAADWSLRTNLCDVPTDCPTRERAGWTGDWQIYVDTAAFLYDVTDFSFKWLLDVAAEQLPSGAVLNFVPDPAEHGHPRVAWWTDLQGSAGWGDAIVHVPWELYRATGRTDFLEPLLDPMRRWVDFAAERAATGRHPDREAQRPVPLPHERYLWDSGFHFGEWNEPERPQVDADSTEGTVTKLQDVLIAQDHGPTATAFLHRSAAELSTIAGLVGRDDLRDEYATLAANAREAWQLEFLDADGHVIPATQPNLVRALAFALVPDELRQQIADDLAALVRDAGSHLATGFLATPFLLPVLADNGHLDVAYELLFQRTSPSWLAMRDHGATTIWEGWDAFDEHGIVKESMNHFSMGAVVGFLHRYVAGLQLNDPGYRTFRVAPRPGGGVTRASTHHDSPYGRIEVSWQLDDGVGSLEVAVPEGCRADVALPDGRSVEVDPGRHRHTWAG